MTKNSSRLEVAPGNYENFLRRYRINRFCLAAALSAFLIAAGYFVATLLHVLPFGPAALIVAAGGFVALAITMLLLDTALPCPACKGLFYGSSAETGLVGWNLFARRCMHCSHVPYSRRA